MPRVNFPLYSLQMLTSHHVLVGGGGGSSNAGVAFGFVSECVEKKKCAIFHIQCYRVAYDWCYLIAGNFRALS
jgi:hypothetical protein